MPFMDIDTITQRIIYTLNKKPDAEYVGEHDIDILITARLSQDQMMYAISLVSDVFPDGMPFECPATEKDLRKLLSNKLDYESLPKRNVSLSREVLVKDNRRIGSVKRNLTEIENMLDCMQGVYIDDIREILTRAYNTIDARKHVYQ